jgi:2-keto-4-pentenoate hydratase/2-oxohepta-3-ene-1,7-dioic acid hydratase in catechol pathway
MKVVVFGPHARVGALAGENVIDLNAGFSRMHDDGDTLMPAELKQFIAAGPAALERAEEVIEHFRRRDEPGVVASLESVRLHAPWTPGSRIACAGGNHAEHMAGATRALTGKVISPEEVFRNARAGRPWGFFKVLDQVLGPDDDLTYPSRAALLDYEAELAVVIGKPSRDLREADVDDAIWGVTLLNDWSIRNDLDPPRLHSFNMPKNFDGSASLGPCIVVGELDPQNVDLELRLNGELRQSYNTREMIYSFAEFLAILTRDFTFRPGDVLSGGTGPGTAFDSSAPRADGSMPPDRFLQRGDVVELSSSSIGVLRNRVVP